VADHLAFVKINQIYKNTNIFWKA